MSKSEWCDACGAVQTFIVTGFPYPSSAQCGRCGTPALAALTDEDDDRRADESATRRRAA